MSSSTSLAMGSDGRLVVIKRAQPGGSTARLRREAEVLRRAVHPGVVELADDQSDGEDPSISTVFVGGGTLADIEASGDLGLVTRTLAVAAATLADLHDRGISHGRVTADHVLVAESGQAVLCGLAEARLPGEGGGDAVAKGDALAFATLARDLATQGDGKEAQALQRLAERALAPDAAARPSLRTLATSLRAFDPLVAATPASAPVPGPRLLPARRAPQARAPRRGVVAAAVVALALVLVGLVATITRTGGGPASNADQPTAAASPTSTLPTIPPPTSTPQLPTSAPPPVRVWPSAPGQPAPAPVTLDVDADGSHDAVEIDAGTIAAGGSRWQVATATEMVVVGDWDCDAQATPAVVRPGSGQVWVYPRWADADEEVAAELAGVAPGAISATTVRPDATGEELCDAIEVTDTAGSSTLIKAPG